MYEPVVRVYVTNELDKTSSNLSKSSGRKHDEKNAFATAGSLCDFLKADKD